MDIATLAGLILGVGMFAFGVISSGGIAGFAYFVDIPSVIITIGGSLSSTLASNKLGDFISGFKSFGMSLKGGDYDPTETIKSIIDLSNVARKEGLLALEESAGNLEDAFLKKGIMLVVDGTDAELVRGILETDLVCSETRHKTMIGFWDKWGEMGPAWGMIGTLVGLVIMLQNLSDSAAIGPSMAVALLTTLYGSLIANWLTGPTSAKLKVNNDLEMTQKTIAIEGLLSIQAGENPRVIEEKLKSFLAPSARDGIGSEAGGGDE